MKENAIENVCKCLLKLKDTSNYLLYFHRRKTLTMDLVSAAKFIIPIAEELLDRAENLFKYLLVLKFLQDHIEICFVFWIA